MTSKEIARLWSRDCEKEGGAKDDGGMVHLETKRGTALLRQEANAVDFSLAFCFCHRFLKNQNYSIIPFPNQIWL